jgi:quercetin dioxygenase-like cupin family protein
LIRNKTIINKPWGHEEIWANTSRYAGKTLHIKAGHRLSRQYHRAKEETIMVLEGTLVLEAGPYHEGDTIHTHILAPGDVFHVSPGTIHRFCADEIDAVLVEVSTSEIDDVVRLEDDYSRIEVPKALRASEK